MDHWCPHLDKHTPQMIQYSNSRFVTDDEFQEMFAKSTWPHPIKIIDSNLAETTLKNMGLTIKYL
jgi:hypothetical protein